MTCPRGLRYVHTVIHTRNEWVGKYEEATVNIYKYFRRINIWRFPGNIRFVSWFFPREKKSCVSVPSIRETGRKVNEFPRVSVPSFTRDDHSRHEYALFDFPFWISPRETALNSVTRTSLELGYAMEGVNSIRGAHTHDIKKKENTLKIDPCIYTITFLPRNEISEKINTINLCCMWLHLKTCIQFLFSILPNFSNFKTSNL